MLKKLGYAARKLILISTIMALVATVTSCGSDDESATESRTRNFSASLDCGEPTKVPEPEEQAPMAETVDEAQQAAADAYAEMQEAEERVRFLEEERDDLEIKTEVAYQEYLENGQTDEDYAVIAAVDDQLGRTYDDLSIALPDMGKAAAYHAKTVNHAIDIGGEVKRNSSADAERNACIAEENQMYADAAAQQAARELELRENDLRLINEQINALDESGVTRDDQIVLTENRVEAEREAAAAAAEVAKLDQITEETEKFKKAMAEFNEEKQKTDGKRTPNYNSLLNAKNAAAKALDNKIDELGLTFSNNRYGYTAGKEQDKFLELIFEDMADADKNAASASEARDDANEYSVIAGIERQVAQQNREALIKKAEMLRDDADSAKNRYFDATVRAQDATRTANEASVALADAIAQGNADAIAAAELAQAQAQAAADAAAQAQLDAQVEADTQEDEADAAESEALITVEPTTGDDGEVEPVLLAGVPTNVDDDTDAAVPAEVMLIDRPVVTVEEVVDELIFNKNNVKDLLIGAGVAVGAVEVKTNSGDWQTLDQTATNALALGTNDEEIEIRITSNDAEPVIVEKVVEVARVGPAASITPEQLAMLLPVASATTSSSSNSGLLIIVVIVGLIALIAVVVVRKKKS